MLLQLKLSLALLWLVNAKFNLSEETSIRAISEMQPPSCDQHLFSHRGGLRVCECVVVLLHQEDKIHMFALCGNCWILINHNSVRVYRCIMNLSSTFAAGFSRSVHLFVCLPMQMVYTFAETQICDYKTIVRWQ